jgi:hypothetical protein
VVMAKRSHPYPSRTRKTRFYIVVFSIDGTAWETVWESRTPPDYSSKSPDHNIFGQGFLHFLLLDAMALFLISIPEHQTEFSIFKFLENYKFSIVGSRIKHQNKA